MKNAIKSLTILLLFISIVSQIEAQKIPDFRFTKGEFLGVSKSEYDKGSIAFHNGTVMKGDIAVSKEAGKITKIRFKDADGEKLEFDPNMVKSYGLDPVDDVQEVEMGKNCHLKLRNGVTHIGKLTCRTVNGDTTHYTIKNADKIRMKFKKSEVLSALMSYDADLKYAPGSVTLKNGQVQKGTIALGTVKPGSGWNQDQHIQTIFFSTDNITQSVIEHTQMVGFQRVVTGKTETYKAYLDGISFQIENGTAVLIRNPYPTDVREGSSFAAKVVGTLIGTGVAVGAAEVSKASEQRALDKKAAKGEYQGEAGLAKAANDINEANARMDSVDAFGSKVIAGQMASNPKVYGKEYVILIQDRDPIFVTKENSESVMAQLLYEVTEFLQMTKKERKKLTGLDEVEEAVRFYNRYAKPVSSN